MTYTTIPTQSPTYWHNPPKKTTVRPSPTTMIKMNTLCRSTMMTHTPLTFRRVEGLYCIDTSNMDESYYAMHNHSTTVKINKLKYTKREVRRADEAMKLRRRLSFPADETIPKMQTIINIPTTRKDLVRSIDKYGKDRNSIRGKATKQKTKTIYMISRLTLYTSFRFLPHLTMLWYPAYRTERQKHW